MKPGPLSGKHVAIAGAGLAGLTAARELEGSGAAVTVIEARERVGGRVQTIRLANGHYAEAGADLIEREQKHVHELAAELGLKPVRILRQGFGYYGPDRSGRRRIRYGPEIFEEAAQRLKGEIAEYRAVCSDWHSPVASLLARRSVADWLRSTRAPRDFAAAMRGLRGFFLADPEELSLLALVDQFSEEGSPGQDALFRLAAGNDALPRALHRGLRGRVLLNTIVRSVRQTRSGVRITVEDRTGRDRLHADYFVSSIPATTLRDVHFEPALPEDQHRAMATLRYGPATRIVLRFRRRFWRKFGRPRAFGTDLPTGAVWEGNEQQRGPAGILTLLAGGRASREVRALAAAEGIEGVVHRLSWLGRPAELIESRLVAWEEDPWARGGYAYFDPRFDPHLREWLSRPAGRIVFAGEHTSRRWQGYMNGAIESGRRVAAELRALAAGSRG